MKVMIIAARYGNGHISVSNAIAKMKNNTKKDLNFTIVVPATHYVKKINTTTALYVYNNIVSKYTKDSIIKKTYDMTYNFGTNTKLFYSFQKNDGRFATKKLLSEINPDVVIETFPCEFNAPKDILRVCVITDYNFAKVYIANTPAIYCIPAPFIKNKLIDAGIKPEAIYQTGIPVKHEFFQENNSTECKKILLTLGARGQISLNDVEKIINSCLKNKIKLIVVCGKNKELYDQLKNRNDIVCYGYVNFMEKLIKEVDCVITKSGGISVSECICSEKPMIINIDQSLGGQERMNQNYIRMQQIGLIGKIEEIDKLISGMCDKDIYQKIVKNIKRVKKENYQENIIDVINKNIIKKDC